jgi:hypothetical protein
MSRQKGSRPRPVPEQRRYHEQFARRSRRVASAAAVADGPISRRRRWGAALGATLVLVFAFTGVVMALVEWDQEDTDAANRAIALAAALAPMVFMVLARVSRAPRPFRSMLLATPSAIAGYIAVGSLVRDPSSSLVLAFGIAGAFVLRAEPVHRVPLRITVVGIASVVTLLLAVVAPAAAVLVAPFVPFPALVVADIYAEARPRT